MTFLKKHADAFLGAGIAIVLFLAVFIFQGFAKYGLSVPFLYHGGDDFASLVTAKLIEESGWFWFNDRIGAPFGATSFDFTANVLLNFDIVVAKIISWFVSDPVAANNLRHILIFPMCGVSAFYVLRTLKINRVISTFGSLIFALTPYIFYRGYVHFSLAAAYFIPLSVLLCIWAIHSEEDDGYLKFNKSFFKNKKNILTLVFSLLIANNGIGYYAFFTCFFLCVVALCNLITTKKWKSIVVPMKTVLMIVVFLLLALLPALIYGIINGGGAGAVVRGIEGAEIYGLKIAQLFIPINSHGIGIVQKLMDFYNTYMPLVNENQGSYLGIFGIIGFLLSLLYLVKRDREEEDRDGLLYVLSRMNLFAILLATVGGFSSLISFVFQMIRGYNRISIFIMFISVLFLCLVLQKVWDKRETLFKSEKTKKALTAVALAVMSLSVLELLPTYGARDGVFEYTKAQYESDKAFVGDIEETLGEGAMVFQLPYHQTPEAGPVNNMMDYHLYAGYINSDTLRWSYGVTKGRQEDAWIRSVSYLPPKDMLDTICKAGFTGLYVDARAYTEAELQTFTELFKPLIGEAKVSSNGNLRFYDLRGYIAASGITVDTSVYSLPIGKSVYGPAQMSVKGEHTVGYNSYILEKDSLVFGPYTPIEVGKYTVTVYGSGLTAAEYDVALDWGARFLATTEISRSDTEITYEIEVTESASITEFRLHNKTDGKIEFNRVEIVKSK